MPQFRFAYVMSSIITIVTMAYAPQMTEMKAAIKIARQLFGALMFGLAVATGISLFFLPLTSRKLVFGDTSAYLSSIRKVLEAKSTFLRSIEHQSMFQSSAESETLRSEVKKLRSVNNKLFADIGLAKKEIAYGHLDAADLSEMHRLLRSLFLPVAGMNQIIDVFERLAKLHGWNTAPRDERSPETNSERVIMEEYEEMMQILHSPIEDVSAAMYDALDHVSILLKLGKPAPKPADEEANRSSSPGNVDFSQYFEKQINSFDSTRGSILKSWCERNKITLSPVLSRDSLWPEGMPADHDDLFATHEQRQLFVLLYVSLMNCLMCLC